MARKKKEIPETVTCPNCSKGRETVYTGRCWGCNYENNSDGCGCDRSYVQKCGVCSGTGLIKPVIYECYHCLKQEYTNRFKPSGWTNVRAEFGYCHEKTFKVFNYVVCNKCDWRPRPGKKRRNKVEKFDD